MDKKKIEEELEKIFFELRWIRSNQNPPVNYSLLIVLSVMTSVIVTIILTR